MLGLLEQPFPAMWDQGHMTIPSLSVLLLLSGAVCAYLPDHMHTGVCCYAWWYFSRDSGQCLGAEDIGSTINNWKTPEKS